jgi:hypothetical protein
MTSSSVIQGTKYSCTSDANVLAMKKLTLDYALKSSNFTPAKIKQLQDDYDTSKKKFDDSPCSKYSPETNACIFLNAQIASMQSSIKYALSVSDVEGANNLSNQLQALRKKYEDDKCGDKLSVLKAGEIASIADSFGELDKARIESDSKYQAKQKIFFGGLVLIGAVVIITMFGKKE